MPDFKKLLSKQVDEIKRPPEPPPGTYYGTIVGHKFREAPWANKTTGEKEAQVEFAIRITHWDADVNDDEANAASTKGKLVYSAFSIDDGQEWPLKMFLDALGVATAGSTLDSTIPQTTNASVMFTLSQRLDKKDPSREFRDVRTLRAAA